MTSKYSWLVGKGIWNSLFGEYFMRDDTSDAQTTIDFPHHEIHEGDHFSAECFQTLGSGGTQAFIVTTPNSLKMSHMLWEADTTGAMEFKLYEWGSTSTGGTSVLPVNSNRNSTTLATTTLEYDPTIADIGTQLACKAWGVTGNPSRTIGGEARGEHEFVLGTNRKYIYHFKSNSADNVFSYHGNWYEHTPSN